MKKVFFKKLQSLTAIIALNAIPVSFAQTETGFAAQSISTGVPVNEKRQSIGKKAQDSSLSQLYLQNSLAHFQAHAQVTQGGQSFNVKQYQAALAMVEEAYQDHFDDVLDNYEKALSEAAIKNDPHLVKVAKTTAEKELAQLKVVRNQKVEEFSRQFGVI